MSRPLRAASLQAATEHLISVWERRPVRCDDVETPRLMFNYIVVQVSEDAAGDLCHSFTNHTISYACYRSRRRLTAALRPSPTCVFWAGAQRPSWMNEWVGPDINVVGPLEIPPSDEFSISESSHLFGKLTWQEAAHAKMEKHCRRVQRLALSSQIGAWRS